MIKSRSVTRTATTRKRNGAALNNQLPIVCLVRHGETTWSLSGQHTGLTDVPLTPQGEQKARHLGARLTARPFAQVLTSGLQRADRTCELAGFKTIATVDSDLVEWDYGDYEGLRTTEIQKTRPGWQLFRDGCPGGESLSQVSDRADRVVHRIRSIQGDVLVFSSGHFLRVLAARWLGLHANFAQYLLLSTASFSVLGYEHSASEPVIRLWNETEHVTTDSILKGELHHGDTRV